ncbi:MAG: phosphoglycerate dehydrogenase [candidate division NC10 bacterium]|nr:phosphoglycerate dehydrogenase [candidate division NC10 bacterium]
MPSETNEPKRILVTDNLAPRGLEVLRHSPGFALDVKNRLTPEELLRCIGDYDALVVRSATKVTAEVLAAGTRLKVVGRAGVGVDNIDLEAATARGVVVMNAPSGNTVTTAEHTIAMLLALAKNIPQATMSLKQGRWEKSRFLNVELFNKVLGVIGLGRVGSEVARRAKALAMRVIAYDPFISREVAAPLGVELVELEEVFRRSDFLSVHVPFGPDTRNLIDGKAIATMKRGVRIINCARGGIVDEQALYEALRSGQVAGAAFDVFVNEPAADSPLLGLDNFICTPHLGSATEEAQENVAIAIAEQVVDFLEQGVVRNAVNAPSIDPELLAKIKPYFTLAEKMGRLCSQLSEGRMQEIRIAYQGEVASVNTAPLTAAVVKGLLDPILSGSVNVVNALPFAKQRGVKVVESKTSEEGDYASLITVTIGTDKDPTAVAGALFQRSQPRVVRINEFSLEAIPEGYLLVFSNMDVPGVIGRIGTLLGKNRVNIAGMQLGRTHPGGRAVSVVNVDTPIPPPVMEEIRRMPDIVFAKLVHV